MSRGTLKVVTWDEPGTQNLCVNSTGTLYPVHGCEPGMTPPMIVLLITAMNFTPGVILGLPWYNNPALTDAQQQEVLLQGVGDMMNNVLNESAVTTTMFFGQRPDRIPDFMWSAPLQWSREGYIVHKGGLGLAATSTALFSVFDLYVYVAIGVVLAITVVIVLCTRFLITRAEIEMRKPTRAVTNSFFHSTTGDAIDDAHYEYETLPYSHKLALLVSGFLLLLMAPIYDGFLLVRMSNLQTPPPFTDGFTLARAIRDDGYKLLSDAQDTTSLSVREVLEVTEATTKARSDSFTLGNWEVKKALLATGQIKCSIKDGKEDCDVVNLFHPEDLPLGSSSLSTEEKVVILAMNENYFKHFAFDTTTTVARHVNAFCDRVEFIPNGDKSSEPHTFLLKRNIDLSYEFIKTVFSRDEELRVIRSEYDFQIQTCKANAGGMASLQLQHFYLVFGILGMCMGVSFTVWLLKWLHYYCSNYNNSREAWPDNRSTDTNTTKTTVVEVVSHGVTSSAGDSSQRSKTIKKKIRKKKTQELFLSAMGANQLRRRRPGSSTSHHANVSWVI